VDHSRPSMVMDRLYRKVWRSGRLGAGPVRVWQSITVGIAGRAAYDGGCRIALLGLILHFLTSATPGRPSRRGADLQRLPAPVAGHRHGKSLSHRRFIGCDEYPGKPFAAAAVPPECLLLQSRRNPARCQLWQHRRPRISPGSGQRRPPRRLAWRQLRRHRPTWIARQQPGVDL
jgi:hypothetical protein